MHTVVLTHAFVRAAKAAGMSEEDVDRLILHVAANPTAGAEIRGTGGCRKIRLAGRGKGKSGGLRTITFFTGEGYPVFLLTVFGKGEKVTLTQAERNALRKITKAIVKEYGAASAPTREKGA